MASLSASGLVPMSAAIAGSDVAMTVESMFSMNSATATMSGIRRSRLMLVLLMLLNACSVTGGAIVRGRAACSTSPRRAGRGRIPSEAKRSDGIRVRGRHRESEPVDAPPHPTCFAALTLRSQVDLSPQAGRGGSKRHGRAPPSPQHALPEELAERIGRLLLLPGGPL